MDFDVDYYEEYFEYEDNYQENLYQVMRIYSNCKIATPSRTSKKFIKTLKFVALIHASIIEAKALKVVFILIFYFLFCFELYT